MQTIRQKVLFLNASPKDLYGIYLNSAKHAALSGSPARISSREGADFSAHGTYISGKNSCLVPDRLIVQTWRAENWGAADPDSTFILMMEQKGKDTILHMVHAGVPDREADELLKGWQFYYWEPMKKMLEASRKKGSPKSGSRRKSSVRKVVPKKRK